MIVGTRCIDDRLAKGLDRLRMALLIEIYKSFILGMAEATIRTTSESEELAIFRQKCRVDSTHYGFLDSDALR